MLHLEHSALMRMLGEHGLLAQNLTQCSSHMGDLPACIGEASKVFAQWGNGEELLDYAVPA